MPDPADFAVENSLLIGTIVPDALVESFLEPAADSAQLSVASGKLSQAGGLVVSRQGSLVLPKGLRESKCRSGLRSEELCWAQWGYSKLSKLKIWSKMRWAA